MEKMKKAHITDVFVRQILRCIDGPMTKDEVASVYLRLYPPNYFERKIGKVRSDEFLVSLDRAVSYLVREGYINTEVISYTENYFDFSGRIPVIRYTRSVLGNLEIGSRKTNKS